MAASGCKSCVKVVSELVQAFQRDPTLASRSDVVRLRAALDTVSAQRDAFASGLYWYTDLESAKAAASESHRAILSLRLLGRLDEELSCANTAGYDAIER